MCEEIQIEHLGKCLHLESKVRGGGGLKQAKGDFWNVFQVIYSVLLARHSFEWYAWSILNIHPSQRPKRGGGPCQIYFTIQSRHSQTEKIENIKNHKDCKCFLVWDVATDLPLIRCLCRYPRERRLERSQSDAILHLLQLQIHLFFTVFSSFADPRCLSRNPYPTFFHPGSRIRIFYIPDPGST
jgi:hypothetical protein